MLDDKDTFGLRRFEQSPVSTLRLLREVSARRLREMEVSEISDLAASKFSKSDLEGWIRDIDAELSERGICNGCFRMACQC